MLLDEVGMRLTGVFAYFLMMMLATADAGAQVMSSYIREQTGTLPRGRFMISMVSVQSSLDRMYTVTGESKSLSSNFNRTVNVSTIVADEPVRGSQLEGMFLSNGMSVNSNVGSIEGSVTGRVDGKVPVIGYGISDDLGVFLNLPIIEFQIDARYQFVQSQTMKDFMARLRADDQTSVAKEFESALNSSLEYKLYRSGYAWNASLKKTVFGDARINVVKVLNNTPEFQSQVQPFLILPTANDQDLHDLYGLRAGDRRLGFGVKYGVQKRLGIFQLNAAVTGTHLFEGVQGRRLPRESSDELNELYDDRILIAGGDQFQSQFQLRYSFPRWVSLNWGLDWKQRWNESWGGSLHDPSLYALAEEKTGSTLFSSYASLDLNSIQSFLEGGFLFPAVAELGLGFPIYGKNAIAEPVVQLQGTMFF